MTHEDYKMHGSTPSGRSRSYSYYVTTEKVGGFQIHVSCATVHTQLPELLGRIQIRPKHIPAIREIYTEHLKSLKGPNVDQRLTELRESAKRIQTEEAGYARLFARGKLSEHNYDLLHQESQTSLAKVNQEIRQIENGHVVFLDGLEQALFIISKAYAIYERLTETQRARLLQIIFERIIIGTEGQIIDFSLNPPFEYLSLVSRSVKEGDGAVPRVDGSSKRFTPSLATLPLESLSRPEVLRFDCDASPLNTAYNLIALPVLFVYDVGYESDLHSRAGHFNYRPADRAVGAPGA